MVWRASWRPIGSSSVDSHARYTSPGPIVRTREDSTQATRRQRRVVVAAAVVMQVGLGSAYAWSTLRIPLSERFGWSIPEVNLTFSVMILSAGLTAFLGGLWMERAGPRNVGLAGGLLYGAGILAAGLFGDRLFALYLGYGLVAGAGLGLAYIVPVATLVGWFGRRRGLVTGVAVGSFALGGLVASPLLARLVDALGVLEAMTALGAVALVVVAGAAVFLSSPPAASGVGPGAAREVDHDLGAALGTWQWYLLWAVFFVNVVAGMGFVSEAVPMAQQIAGASRTSAAAVVGSIFVADALGRFGLPLLSDRVGRPAVLTGILLLQATAFFALPAGTSPALFGILGTLVLLAYGGASGTMPALTADLFGARHLGSIYGLMLTAWGVGGVVGPLLIATVRESTGSYTGALYAVSALMLASAALPLLVRPPRAHSISSPTAP